MSIRNIIALILILISLVCLYPGLFEPIMSINVSTEIPILGKITLQESTNSIISTITDLRDSGNTLVAFLILFFSILVPLIKAGLLLVVLCFPSLRNRFGIHKFVAIISKWSMADVFVVGVLIAYLGTKSDSNIHAQLHNGFYFFLAYCLISILSSQIIENNHISTSDIQQ